MFTPLIIALVVGYLLGALPFGYLVARSKGVNIFEEGSRNPGATNVLRVLSAKFGRPGKRLGMLVFLLDALKGAAATGWPLLVGRFSEKVPQAAAGLFPPERAVEGAVAGLIGALVGHSFSCFTKFRGGKGVATATGGLLVLMPLAIAIGAVVWAATFYSLRFVSLASILAAVSMPISAFFLREERLLQGLTVVIAVLVVLRHRTNIQRLMAGTESKFVKKEKAGAR